MGKLKTKVQSVVFSSLSQILFCLSSRKGDADVQKGVFWRYKPHLRYCWRSAHTFASLKLHRPISAWVTAVRGQVSYGAARNGLPFTLQNQKPLFRYTAASASICQLCLAAWHLGGVQWIPMTYSLPKQEACRDGVGEAFWGINSIDGHFFFYPVRVCTVSKRRSGAVKHLLTSLWSGMGRRSCHRLLGANRGSLPEERFSHGLTIALVQWWDPEVTSSHSPLLYSWVGTQAYTFSSKANVRYRLPGDITTVASGWALEVTLSISRAPCQLSTWKSVVTDRCLSEGQREGSYMSSCCLLLSQNRCGGKIQAEEFLPCHGASVTSFETTPSFFWVLSS